MSVDTDHLRARGRRSVVALCAAACGLAVLAGPARATREPPRPALSPSDFAVRAACSPGEPLGHARCLALRLQPSAPSAIARVSNARRHIAARRTAAGSAGEAAHGLCSLMPCLTPTDLHDAYLPGEAASAPKGSPQTIAVVDAYNDYAAEADLNAYSTEFGLPTLKRCETENEGDCFTQVNQVGRSEEAQLPFPHSEAQLLERENACLTATTEAEEELACTEAVEAEGWAVETSTDVETAHAICNDCKILLLEAGAPLGSRSHYANLEEAEEAFSYADLDAAEETPAAGPVECPNPGVAEEPG